MHWQLESSIKDPQMMNSTNEFHLANTQKLFKLYVFKHFLVGMDTVKLVVPTLWTVYYILKGITDSLKSSIASIFLIKAFKCANLTPPFLPTIR